MVDKDGSSRYSSIVNLSQTNINGISVYPNPAKDHVTVTVATAGSISIYDASGRLMKVQGLHAGGNSIDVSAWGTGLYYGVVGNQKLQFVKE